MRCTKCPRTDLTPKDFRKQSMQCRNCQTAKVTALRRKYQAEGKCFCGREPTPGKKLCERHQATHRDRYHQKLKGNPEWVSRMNASYVAANRVAKLAAFDAYGGRRCACCGEEHLEFLTLDHIDPATAVRGDPYRCGPRLYRLLRRQGYPQGFRVLCMNCNFARGNFGGCPHERERGPGSD